MKKFLLLLLICLFFAGCNNKTATQPKTKPENLRIVSLAPSVTNMITGLGAEDYLVGVTKFCQNPEKKWTEIGGYMDFNREVFVSLKPNMVFLAPYHTEAIEICEEMNIEYHILNLSSYKDIRKNIVIIGEHTGKLEKAGELVDNFNKELFKIKPSKKHPRVLIVLDRNYGTKDLGKIYAVGDGGIFAEPLSIIGAFNAYEGLTETPVLTAEGVVSLNPDIIIDVVPENRKDISKDWEGLKINAVKNRKLYVLAGKEYSVPDQFFYRTVQKLAEIINE